MDFNITWKAIYKDKKIKEHSSINKDKYADIDRSKLECIEVSWKGNLIFTQEISGNKRLVMRYRIQRDLMDPSKTTYVFLIGWQKTNLGANTQEITYIFDDGHMVTHDKWDSSIALYSEPILRSDEK